MANKDDWISWGLAIGAAAIFGYIWMTSQKAGAQAGQGQGQGIAIGEPNPSAPQPKEAEGGCGCGMEPKT